MFRKVVKGALTTVNVSFITLRAEKTNQNPIDSQLALGFKARNSSEPLERRCVLPEVCCVNNYL